MSALRQGRRGRLGFTIIELGVTIGVIAALVVVVIAIQGFQDSARIGQTVRLVERLREAGRDYSRRFNGGANFNLLTMGALLDAGYFERAPADPWFDPSLLPEEEGGEVRAAISGYSSGPCAGNTCMDIVVCAGGSSTARQSAEDLAEALEDMCVPGLPVDCPQISGMRCTGEAYVVGITTR